MSRPGESGAALLEVVLAVAVTAMLAGATAQAVRFGLQVVERASAAQAASAAALRDRRIIASYLQRIETNRPGRPSFFGARDVALWRGAAPDSDGGWRVAAWRLSRGEDELTLSECGAVDPEADCEAVASFAPVGPLAYAGADGVIEEDWTAGAAPSLIILGGGDNAMAIQPRVAGALR